MSGWPGGWGCPPAFPRMIPSGASSPPWTRELSRPASRGIDTGWVRAVAQATDGQVVALDGKVLRGSHDRATGRAALDLVSAWASANRLVLAQVAVVPGSNEIPAIPALLRLLALRGRIVTIDAIGCQTAIAQAIRAQGADYVLALKANQESLYQAVVAAFAERGTAAGLPYGYDTHREVDKGHGRVEVRTTTVIDDPALLAWLNPDHAWEGLRGVARVEAERRIAGEASRETRYYLTSLTAARLVHDAVRSHWASRTACTGSWAWPSVRTSPAYELARAPTISPCCAASPSTCSARTIPPAVASRPAASRLPSVLPTSSLPSIVPFRCNRPVQLSN